MRFISLLNAFRVPKTTHFSSRLLIQLPQYITSILKTTQLFHQLNAILLHFNIFGALSQYICWHWKEVHLNKSCAYYEMLVILRKTWRSCFWLFTAWMIGKLNLPSVRSSQKLLLSEYCHGKKNAYWLFQFSFQVQFWDRNSWSCLFAF